MSSALTGPWPSATDMRSSPSTTTFTIASETVFSWPLASKRRSTMQRNDVTWKNSGTVVQRAPRQQLEARIGALIGVALGLALLDQRNQRVEPVVVLRHLDAAALQLGDEIGLAALVGDHDLAAVADRFRRHVLVGRRLLGQRRGMDAGLGGEGRQPDIGRLRVRRAVEQFVESCATAA